MILLALPLTFILATSADVKGDKAVSVGATPPTRRSLMRELEIPATLKPQRVADLYAKTSGYVSEVRVDIGSLVKKGDALLEIDVPEMADDLAQARAILGAKKAYLEALAAKTAQADAMIEIARSEVGRVEAEHQLKKITAQRKEKLAEEKVISPQELDEARGELIVAEAQIKIAQSQITGAEAQKKVVAADILVAQSEVEVAKATIARLETLMRYATVRAPFDGVITDRLVDPGAFIRSAEKGDTMAMFNLAKVDQIRLSLDIPESDVPLVRVGTAVDIDVLALEESESIHGEIQRTTVALNPKTRTMRAEVDLDNKAGLLAAGMYAQVTVQLETRQNALLVPSKTLRVRDNKVSLLVARQGVAEAVGVQVGYDDGIWAEIVAGELREDDWVITSAQSTVAPGTPVKVVDDRVSAASL
jgi:RND family efflux transporter MFP subunit